MREIILESLDWRRIVAVAVLLLAFPVGVMVRRVLLQRLARLAARTSLRMDDVVVASLRGPIPFWFLLAAAAAAVRLAAVPEGWIPMVDRILGAGTIASLTFWATDLVARTLRSVAPAEGRDATPVTGVVVNVARLAVIALGGLMLLSNLGISVTPILTTVGIGGLAVALGLQDTFANLFAGVQVTLAGNIRVGDYIRLDAGQEGIVEDIRWRTTRIRTLPGNIVLVPNGKLAQSIVTNYHLPATEMALLVQVGVHYSSDLDRVERVVIEEAARVLRSVAGGVAEFEPFIRYHTFGESSIDFTVILRVRQFTDQYLVKHEFIKALARRFAAEGIVIPFPIRALNLVQEGASIAAPPALAS